MSRHQLVRAACGLLGLCLAACQGEPPSPERAFRPPTPAPPLGGASSAPSASPADAVSSGSGGTQGTAAATEAAPAVPATEPVSEPAVAGAGASRPLGWIAGQPLSAEELVREWHRIAGREVWLVLDKLVATRLAYAEAERLELRLAPEAVELRVDAELARAREEVAKKHPDLGFEEFIEREFEEPLEHSVELMRVGAIRQMLAERVARTWTLENENRSLRVIVVDEAELAATLLERARNGEDFAALAREFSLDDTAEHGGFVPYVVRQEHSPLARLAFTTAPGELGGPLAIEPSGHLVIVRVEEHREPLLGDWRTVAAAVEASLARDPLSDSEFLHWKLAMERRYPIDVGPLEALLRH